MDMKEQTKHKAHVFNSNNNKNKNKNNTNSNNNNNSSNNNNNKNNNNTVPPPATQLCSTEFNKHESKIDITSDINGKCMSCSSMSVKFLLQLSYEQCTLPSNIL